MTLRTSAKQVAGRGAPISIKALRDEPCVVAREREIASRFGLGGNLRPPLDLEEICTRVTAALKTGQTIARRDLRQSPLCIWTDDEGGIAADRDLLSRLLAHIAAEGRRSVTRMLAAVYLRQFRTSRPGIDLVGRTLQRLVTPETPLLHELQTRFGVFDPMQAPACLAGYCLMQKQPPHRLFANLGLNAAAVRSGLGAVVYREGMRMIAEEIAQGRGDGLVEQAFAWADTPADEQYVDHNVVLANTLLLPFRETTPTDAVRDRILDALLDRIGDPRLRTQNWVRMREAAEVARRWLTRFAVRQFLEIVDDTAYPQQWEYRRAFWTALLDKEIIQEAWVAFGLSGAERARRDFGKNTPFGRLRQYRKNVETGHAVLIMRLGDYTMADWSHNGRCIAWSSDDDRAPRLYAREYHSGDLAPDEWDASIPLSVRHAGSESYSWQMKVAAFVTERTGCRLSMRDYRVR